ncbi:DUF4397 domain-containing protein [Nocardioides dongxiaopingii]|uniref:DUF4397 domain-containing protein n=1 Tax=Nocardioides dongxiaopingii TaxID=2576036 RepID=UPI0010C76DD3|nr:DUF4397 domain-containing protein [Nocardioides dongxiaopingii]
MGLARLLIVGVVTSAVAAVTAAAAPGSGAGAASPPPRAAGSVVFVQAVPGAEMVVSVDGEEVAAGLADGAVAPPVTLDAGPHAVEFAFDGGSVEATVEVGAGSASDVVVHNPAAVDGDPVVSIYPTPMDPIGPGKARVVLAHTATTAPADVEVDGQVVFTNIANGEYAEADVAAGAHQVALLPSGIEGEPILGPLEVTLRAGTLTSVYAVGNPRRGSMRVIVRETPLRGDGTEAPTRVETGSAGLAVLASPVS